MAIGQGRAQGIDRGMTLAIKGQFAGQRPSAGGDQRVGAFRLKLKSEAVYVQSQLPPATQAAGRIKSTERKGMASGGGTRKPGEYRLHPSRMVHDESHREPESAGEG